jgi:hypothetical protein
MGCPLLLDVVSHFKVFVSCLAIRVGGIHSEARPSRGAFLWKYYLEYYFKYLFRYSFYSFFDWGFGWCGLVVVRGG